MDERERHAKGMEIRRQVLGDAHVEGARAATTELTADFQDLITRYAWGEIWARPGLPRRTRSLVTIAMLVALNRPEELRLHLRAAAACGVTRDDLRELLLHAAVYCGVPAAHAAFHLAEAELPPARQAQGERGDPGNPKDDGGRT
jgi:4-carboxymuconolactone decarboxylase